MAIKNIEEMTLTELIDADTLQHIQDSFAGVVQTAALITDENGVAVTEGSFFSEFCRDHVRKSPLGTKLCQQCVKYGAENTLKAGRVTPCLCHAGLLHFSAPITMNGRIIGCLVGGQTLAERPDEEQIRLTAEELKLDGDVLWEKAQFIPIKPREELERTSNFLHVIANILSDMAYGKYLAMKASEEIVNASSAKADFLANMSHEIRTPMNAVIGMAEMALREDLTDVARDYINQIKSSGKALLTIINDILDYSKIESGKMELNEVEYEPMSLIHDVSSILMTRLTDKDVELLLDCDPDLPCRLYGDDLRIRQVLINIANNATKFTNSGHVRLRVRFEWTDQETILLKVQVQDTGIGIKKEDIQRLFSSFQQVDSKRNRNVEGTGLGLAICKQLVGLMGGQIRVESEYGVGSTFSFDIPQKVVDRTPSITLDESHQYAVAGFFAREDVAEDFKSNAMKLGIHITNLTGAQNPNESVLGWLDRHKTQQTYILFEQALYERIDFSRIDEDIFKRATIVLLVDAFADVRQWSSQTFLKIIKKPLSVLNLANLFSQEETTYGQMSGDENDTSFEAPEAKVLIVDDNAINLTVAEGLLEPLHMKIDTAISGKKALEKLNSEHYDIIFMDHMMPELDGVETTRIIRRLHPECNDTPIIALTANAMSGTKEMFLNEGMNDFVAKPIEVRVLMSKVKQWLPQEKIQRVSAKEGEEGEPVIEKTPAVPETLGDLDLKSALSLLGSEKLFWKVFKDYYRVIGAKADTIEQLFYMKDWVAYTVEVHALKSASKQIGAKTLSEMAADLEKAGNARDIDKITRHTADMLVKYRSYEALLAPYCEERESDEGGKEEITDEKLQAFFARMREALENLDMDEMENVIGEMDAFRYPDAVKGSYAALKEAVSNVDVDSCEEIMSNWKK